MRVITGSARGRGLKTVKGTSTRPTSDRVKEALFSTLTSRFELRGIHVLDLFAGTGALGIEALSRGAKRAVFVERDRAARRVLEANLAACGFSARARVFAAPVERALEDLKNAGARFDGVLLDPPYKRGLLERTLGRLGEGNLLARGGWLVAERHADEALARRYGALRLTQDRLYGKTGLALFVIAETE
jgi:16S rRNA (guanine966-N2)-methyltransferase